MSLKQFIPNKITSAGSAGIIIIFLLMLVFPQVVFSGASEGLLLWFHTVLPTLLPFIIITNLLLHTRAIDWILTITSPVLCYIFRVTPYGSFAVLTGFLCGYPMGSKVTADLLKEDMITSKEGRYLLSFCNNTSPMFIIGYVIWQNLRMPEQTVPFFLILIFSPILCSFLFRWYNHVPLASNRKNAYNRKHKASNAKIESGRLLDTCIMDGFETITKVGGYIMLFSILSDFAEQILASNQLLPALFLASLEITNGIPMIGALSASQSLRIVLTLGLVSFGGWCSIAQTRSMLQGTDLPLLPYIIEKLITSLVTSLLAYCYILLQ